MRGTQPFQPDAYFPSLAKVDYRWLRNTLGVTHVLLDLDGTLAKPWSWQYSRPGLDNLWQAMGEGRIICEACIVTNVGIWPYALRALWIASQAELPVHCCAWPGPMKPDPAVFEAAMRRFVVPPTDLSTVAVIGDQSWTDGEGAKAFGARAVLVAPLGWVSWAKRRRQFQFHSELKTVV